MISCTTPCSKLSTATTIHLHTSTKLPEVGYPWVAELADFDLNIKYHPQKTNNDVDVLSSLPLQKWRRQSVQQYK